MSIKLKQQKITAFITHILSVAEYIEFIEIQTERYLFLPQLLTLGITMKFLSLLNIKLRIAILALIPAVGLLAFLTFSLMDRMNVLSETDKMLSLASLTSKVSTYVHALQSEAGASAAFVASKGKDVSADLTALHVEGVRCDQGKKWT